MKAYQCVEHVYGETLVSDETSHWHQCTVCGAKTGIEAHSYTDKKFDGNGHWAVCACGAETHHDKHSLTAKHNESQHWQECVCGYKTGETAHELTSKYDTAEHWQECECGYATDKTDHSMERKSSADGHWDACACGYKTDVTAHAWTDKFDTQNHWQECSGCGYQKDVTAHSLTKNVNETQHQVKCESCGYKTEWENHTGGTATCTAKAVCSVCGESYGELAAHVADSTYRYNADGHWTACATCGTPMSNQEAHTGGTADCQHKAVCDVCGQPYGELDASNHTGGIRWVQTAETHQAFYLCCGAAAGAEANHSWNDESVCTECGYGCAHTGGTATCTALAVCDICGHTYGDLLPHDYRWVIDQEATTEATGLKHEECTVCGDKRSEGTEIPAAAAFVLRQHPGHPAHPDGGRGQERHGLQRRHLRPDVPRQHRLRQLQGREGERQDHRRRELYRGGERRHGDLSEGRVSADAGAGQVHHDRDDGERRGDNGVHRRRRDDRAQDGGRRSAGVSGHGTEQLYRHRTGGTEAPERVLRTENKSTGARLMPRPVSLSINLHGHAYRREG